MIYYKNSQLFDAKTILIVCIIFSFRMLGLFIVLPFLNIQNLHFLHGNKLLAGLAVGSYGFSQAIFQIPVGILSDRIGRKFVILFGSFLFLLGSLIAAIHLSIWNIIFGRILQGSGATSSVIIALLFDLIKKENRSKAMMCIGITFLLTFSISIIVGSVILQKIGLCNLFWIITIISILNILLISFFIPNSNQFVHKKTSNYKYVLIEEVKNIFFILKNWDLTKLNVSAFITNFILMLNFFIFPKKFSEMNFETKMHWKIYLISIIFSLLISYYMMIITENKNCTYFSWISSMFFLSVSQFLLYKSGLNSALFFLGIVIFFTVFYLNSTFLPVLIRIFSSKNNRGMTMGVCSTFQFLGTATGGSLGGYLCSQFNVNSVFLIGGLISLSWFFAIILDKNQFKKNLLISDKKFLNV